jgi:hypothetical protein
VKKTHFEERAKQGGARDRYGEEVWEHITGVSVLEADF